MIAAGVPEQRPPDAKVLVVDRAGRLSHWPRRDVGRLFHPGDLVIANDAATLPASLVGRHVATGRRIEVRLAGRDVARRRARERVHGGALRPRRLPHAHRGSATATGGRSWRPSRARVHCGRPSCGDLHDHPRLVSLAFDGTPTAIWEGLARHGRPIQYAHVPQPLVLWDTWTPIATAPVAFEPPSAGFALDWRALSSMRARGTRFATITHAAGLSSTGDPELDALLPFDEPYRIPERTAVDTPPGARRRPARRGDRNHRRARPRARGRPRRDRPRRRWGCDATDRPVD